MPVERKDIEKLIREHRVTSCLGCGKCTAVCPLGRDFGDHAFSHLPRGIIEAAFTDTDIVMDEGIWHCLTCEVCTERCPAGVRIRDFVEALRRLALAHGHDAFASHCDRCGTYLQPTVLRERIERLLTNGGHTPEFVSLCPGCRAREYARQVRDA